MMILKMLLHSVYLAFNYPHFYNLVIAILFPFFSGLFCQINWNTILFKCFIIGFGALGNEMNKCDFILLLMFL